MEAEKMLWNVKEAGSALSLSPWTIRRYISDGKLRTVRMGRRVLVEPAECRRFVEECRKALRPRASREVPAGAGGAERGASEAAG